MKVGKVKIRKFRESDKRQILNLMDEFNKYYRPINPYAREAPDLRSAAHFTNKTLRLVKKNGVIFVVEVSGKIIAFLSVYLKVQSRDDVFDDIPMRLGFINDLFVKEEYRGQRLGHKLMEIAEDFLREKNCTHSTLMVFGYNRPAYKFYKDLGYIEKEIEMIKTL